MERLNRLLRRGLLLALSLVCLGAQAQPLRQVFLVQNSGWMEPFYLDPASGFKPLITQLAATAAGNGEVVIGAFNQADSSHPSPQWTYRGPGTHAKLGDSVNALALARKASGAYADTDFKEALLAAIKTGLEGREGIIWIVTNNKNSPNNSSETSLKNREFYDLLHNEASITRIAAFPQKMPVTGPNYQANGLMIYALAYGDNAGKILEQILAQPEHPLRRDYETWLADFGAAGFDLQGVDVALALHMETTATGGRALPRSWLSLKATADSATEVGIPFMSLQASAMAIDINAGTAGDNVVDLKAGKALTLGVSEVTGGHTVRNFQLLRRGRPMPINKANFFAKHMCETKLFCSNFRTISGAVA
mgnify:CR=1 FL=1